MQLTYGSGLMWPLGVLSCITITALNLSGCGGGNGNSMLVPTTEPPAGAQPTPNATAPPGATSTPRPGSSPMPPGSSKIVFTSNRDGNAEIYSMNPDGTRQTRLTHNAAPDGIPNYSPDGRKIAFTSNRGGNFGIYVMNADGSHPVRLTNDSLRAVYPVWSPDGRRIAFISASSSADAIYVMNADGSNLRRLTIEPTNVFERVAWNPDSRRLIFAAQLPSPPRAAAAVSPRSGSWNRYQIRVLNVDGGGLTPLAGASYADRYPSYSPDGRRIVFVRSGDESQIGVMNADGSGRTILTHTGSNYQPVFSPDGRKIAFMSYLDRNAEIYVMNADGSNKTRLTTNLYADTDPDWR